jgi:pre-mRNA-processing factor 6
MEKFRDENPKIVETFRDLKRGLKDVSYAEWDAIPDIGDYTIKKKKLNVGFMPAPDTLLAKALAEKETVNTAADAGGEQDLTAVGEGRGTVLGLKLDRLSDSVTGQTTIDPKGYLTDLGSQKITSAAEISDIKKARLLLKSVINTNPKHGPGWIAAARLEELAGKLQQARVFMQKGCEECPKNEDVWIEAARLNTPENAKAILARGVQTLPNSVKIWMQAAQFAASVGERAEFCAIVEGARGLERRGRRQGVARARDGMLSAARRTLARAGAFGDH